VLWVKLQLPATSFWLELPAETVAAKEQIKGIELGAKLFSRLPVRVIDTRYSKHPTESTYDHETIQQIVKEENDKNID
jgi:hypothetical protein